jgi:hypothetical protein
MFRSLSFVRLTRIPIPSRPRSAAVRALVLLLVCALPPLAGCRPRAPLAHEPVPAAIVYSNDFNGSLGSTFAEWTSMPLAFHKSVSGIDGSIRAPMVQTVESPNHRERFLGEFGGPPVGRPGDPDWNRTRVDQTVLLSLRDFPAHRSITIKFDLYVLKSWDGDSPQFGPDRFFVRVIRGPTLLDATFSNNPKLKSDGSYQSYPGATDHSPRNLPWTGAKSVGTLGYSDFFADSIYHFEFTFHHVDASLQVAFGSSLFEGKGTADESWGLDNVSVSVQP